MVQRSIATATAASLDRLEKIETNKVPETAVCLECKAAASLNSKQDARNCIRKSLTEGRRAQLSIGLARRNQPQ